MAYLFLNHDVVLVLVHFSPLMDDGSVLNIFSIYFFSGTPLQRYQELFRDLSRDHSDSNESGLIGSDRVGR